MADLETLERKITELEKRIKRLEDNSEFPIDPGEKEWQEQLYKKAKELVVKHNKDSAIFLQKKLFIDFARASKIIEKLKGEGVIK